MQHQHLLQEHLAKLTRIGIALSSERDLQRLLDLIVAEARALTHADGGTLYLVEGDPPHALKYSIMQTGTLQIRLGGATGKPIPFPDIPLFKDGAPNNHNICAYAANTGETIHIPDCYAAAGFDFTGPKQFDAATGYRSRSFLVVPMRDHEEQIIGVLQLINATDPQTGELIPFAAELVETIEALASQAAVAITNVRLIRENEQLFEALAEVMASAIDERSPATAGHIKRVAQLTLALAEAVNQQQEGRFAGHRFSADELRELRLAALLHDVGKVTTPLHVIEKRNKLETIYDRGNEVWVRFELIKQQIECQYLKQRIVLMEKGAPAAEMAALEAEMQARLQEVTDDQAFITEMNLPQEFVPAEQLERVRAIAAKTFRLNGVDQPYLQPDEVKHLTIQKGNITGEELQIMRDHAAVTIRLLAQIPFTRKLKNIVKYAGAHHELLNGKGYPLGLSGNQIPLQTRMMSIADIYDALTASDRSYKKARSREEALSILRSMARNGELDHDLVELFITSGVYMLAGKPADELGPPSPAAAAAPGKQA